MYIQRNRVSLLVCYFCNCGRNKRRASLESRAKKNPHRATLGKVLNVTRGRETRRGAHHPHARIARARDTHRRRWLIWRPDLTRGVPPHLTTDSARTRDRGGSRATFLARPTLPRSVARFLRTRFRLARGPRRRAGGDKIPAHRTARAGVSRARCFSVRCFSVPARRSRR